MKHGFFKAFAAAAVITLTACNNDGASSDATDSAANANSTEATSNTATSEGSYAAMADSIERNSEQGYYLNPQTGKSYGKLKVDRKSGRITTEGGEPVWRYVDNRNWWVYGDDNMDDSMNNWNQVGEARMDGEKIMYKGDGDKWVDYDTKWKKEDDEWKMKQGDTKIKVEDDEMKIKDGDKKIKVEDDEMKIKNGDKKTKIDEDGVKQKN
jgi:hypothetical protein